MTAPAQPEPITWTEPTEATRHVTETVTLDVMAELQVYKRWSVDPRGMVHEQHRAATSADLIAALAAMSPERREAIGRAAGMGDSWKDTAAQHAHNEQYYRWLLDQTATHLGPEVFRSDDGSVQDSPLRPKVPELVAALTAERDAMRKAWHRAMNYLDECHVSTAQALLELDHRFDGIFDKPSDPGSWMHGDYCSICRDGMRAAEKPKAVDALPAEKAPEVLRGENGRIGTEPRPEPAQGRAGEPEVIIPDVGSVSKGSYDHLRSRCARQKRELRRKELQLAAARWALVQPWGNGEQIRVQLAMYKADNEKYRKRLAKAERAESRAVAAEAERDAYKRAKSENDERFMRERDEAHAERDAALAQLAAGDAGGWRTGTPALHDSVLVTFKECSPTYRFAYWNGTEWRDPVDHFRVFKEPLAWRPLPAPYVLPAPVVGEGAK